MSTITRQAGLSLVEVMVGMVLGLIVVSGAVAIYLASSRSYSEAEQVGQLSENSRFVEQILTDGLRHAGFVGEASADKIEVNPVALGAITDNCAGPDNRADAYRLGFPIYAAVATDEASSPDIGCIANDPGNDALEDSEILIIKSAVPLPISDGPRDTGPTQASHTNNVLDFPSALLPGKLYLLTNNVIGRMFDSDTTPHPAIAVGGDIPGGAAWEYRYELYFIRDVSNADGKAMPRLSRMVLAESSPGGAMALTQEDLVPGVEDMRMRFGLDTVGNDGEVDVYQTVAQVNAGNNWDSVVAIEIALLVSSQEEDVNYTDANTYTLAGYTVTPHATRLQHRRQVVRANVSLRNIKFVIRGSKE